MKFNPMTQRLCTDDNVKIKILDCPVSMSWGQMEGSWGDRARRCTICGKSVTDTVDLSDDQVLSITRADPSACLKVDLNQDNIRVVNHDV